MKCFQGFLRYVSYLVHAAYIASLDYSPSIYNFLLPEYFGHQGSNPLEFEPELS